MDTNKVSFGMLIRDFDYKKMAVIGNPDFSVLTFGDIATWAETLTNDSAILTLMGNSLALGLANRSSSIFDSKFNEFDINKAINMTLVTMNAVG